MLEAHRKNDIMINIGDYPVEIKTSSYKRKYKLAIKIFLFEDNFFIKKYSSLEKCHKNAT